MSLSCVRDSGSHASGMGCGCPSWCRGYGSILAVECGTVSWVVDSLNSSLGLDSLNLSWDKDSWILVLVEGFWSLVEDPWT